MRWQMLSCWHGRRATAAAMLLVLLSGCAPRVPVGAGATAGRRIELGASVEGRPLVLQVYGTGAPTTLVIAGIHGDEAATTEVARRLAECLGQSPPAPHGRAVAVLVAANPDGLERRTRTNARGVDLNRNFPARNWRAGRAGRRDYGGPGAASEPETQAILRALALLQPERILALHSWDRGQGGNNYDGPAAALAQRMAARNGYPVLASLGGPTPGSLGNWAGVDRGIPIITLELPKGASGAACWERNRAALLEATTADVPRPTSP